MNSSVSASETSESIYFFSFHRLLFIDFIVCLEYVLMYHNSLIQTSNRKDLLELFKRGSNKSQERVLSFDQWETRSGNYKPLGVFVYKIAEYNKCLLYFDEFIQTEKRHPASLDIISILTRILLVISSQNFSCELNSSWT